MSKNDVSIWLRYKARKICDIVSVDKENGVLDAIRDVLFEIYDEGVYDGETLFDVLIDEQHKIDEIVLTPELLESNGWDKRHDLWCKDAVVDGYKYRISWRADGKTYMGYGEMARPLAKVGELNALLALCGMDRIKTK